MEEPEDVLIAASPGGPPACVHPRTARTATMLACGLLLAFAAVGTRPISPNPSNADSVLAPTIPPQPGGRPGTCPGPQAAPDTWTKLIENTAPYPSGGPVFQVTVDPWSPCVMYRATSQQDLQRSVDSGQTWQPIFHDSKVSTVTGSAFAARDLQVPRRDALVMAEGGNGDAALSTDDQGNSWRLIDGGLQGKKIDAITVAPGHPDVMYATVDRYVSIQRIEALQATPEPVAVYVSRDRGTSWTPALLLSVVGELLQTGTDGVTLDPRMQVQVDPDDPRRVWILVNIDNRGSVAYAAILESRDYGTTWTVASAPDGTRQANQFLVVRTDTHGLRLYLNPSASPVANVPSPPLVSQDDGANWRPLPLQRLAVSALAVNPANPDEMMYAGYFQDSALGGEVGARSDDAMAYAVTYDSWDHVQAGTSLQRNHSDYPVSPLRSGGSAGTDVPSILLQADQFGSFYLLMRDAQHTGQYSSQWTSRQAFYRLTPVGPPGSNNAAPPAGTIGGGGSSTSGGAGGGQGSGQSSDQSVGPVAEMAVVRACNVPLTAGGTAGQSDEFGSLAFDGDNLLYTQSPDAANPPHTGTIFRLDPQTCARRLPLQVNFDPAQLATVEKTVHDAAGSWSNPHVDTLAYDHGHDTIWMSVDGPYAPIPAGGGHHTLIPIFSATVDPSSTSTPTAVNATLRFFIEHGGFSQGADLLAYDFTDDTLWSRSHGGAGHIDLDGRQIPSCWDSSHDGGNLISTWVLGAPGLLYVQSEDDQTIWEVDDSTCNTVRTFQHRNFGESYGENEQMACDALTFGVDSAYAETSRPTSAIWLRDAVTQQVVAYAIPDGVCPFPTTTKYLGSTQSNQSGQTRFCAQLDRRGHPKPIPNRPIVFSLAGDGLGTGTTNRAGVACVDHQVALAGGVYPVVARFPGDDQYLPSQDTGTLPLAITAGALTILALGLPAQPALGSGQQLSQAPEPAPVSQAQVAEQAEAQINAQVQVQAQAQAQAQSQAQAQAHTMAQAQPGLMVQRRTREQVASQTVGIGQRQADPLLASRRQPLSPGPAIHLIAASLLLGLGFVVRRPALARASRRRRSPRF